MTRILIIRTSSLGDIAQALPVLTALRRHLPAARIAWLVEDTFAPLLRNHPDLDRLIEVRLRRWRLRPLSPRTLRDLGRFLAELQDFSPEVVLDLMGNHKAGVLAALTLADQRIGFARDYRREPSSAIWLSRTTRPTSRHSVDKMLSVLTALDLPAEPVDFGGERLLAAQESAQDPEPSPYLRVLIHPGAGWDNKRYPAESWGRVAQRLQATTGVTCGVLVGLGEEALVEAVVATSQGSAEPVEAPGLPDLVRLLSRSDLVLAGDTGPLHLAHALGRQVLCLMGPTDPACCGPYAALDRAIWRQLPCSFCHKRYARTMPCLREIPPAIVADRAQRLLEGRPLPPGGPVGEGEAGCLILH